MYSWSLEYKIWTGNLKNSSIRQISRVKMKFKTQAKASIFLLGVSSTYPCLSFSVKFVKRDLWCSVYNIHHELVALFDRTEIKFDKRTRQSFRRHIEWFKLLLCVTNREM